MKHCPITYEQISDSEWYSLRGLHMLSPKLKQLAPLAFSASEQGSQAVALMGKMSIQGVQKKLSAQLKIKEERFSLVDQFGHYILKPQSEDYPELPQNEAITMTLASAIGIDVPIHGMIYSKDNSMTYFIKRFDRAGHRNKIATEDFAQLSGMGRDTKYESSMEKVVSIIETFCTYPKIELVKLFRLTLFNFLIGNEDMHLKKFSLITRGDIISLSPAYDLLNTTIVLPKAAEEIALPLHGKKHNLSKKDFLNYFAIDQLKLTSIVIEKTITTIHSAIPGWKNLIADSFLSPLMKEKYLKLLDERLARFD